ncbi:MAG TPA: alpha/beta fold hydrolase [Candidatus Limiplasma sp.]|nr:alpha/beta fold hydrolase [Candidatus Limiplasma sp.]HPS81392.1 alpha/beta fold hydrolase [Candidatus Limiplasma sp.]
MEPWAASHFDVSQCKPFFHEGGEQGVLLLHGFTGSVAHMRPLGDALADRGYTVMGINLPGHAATEGEMAVSDGMQWLNAARDAALQLRKHCKTLTVAGLSMGGLLALLLAEEGLPDRCVTISTPMATRRRLLRFAPLIALVKPRISWAPTEERHQMLDQRFDFGYSGFPTRKVADLNRLIHQARSNLSRVRCPLLAVQSTGDRVVWPGSADCILAGVESRRKQKLILDGVPHVCTISRELPTLVSAMDQWLQDEGRDASQQHS